MPSSQIQSTVLKAFKQICTIAFKKPRFFFVIGVLIDSEEYESMHDRLPRKVCAKSQMTSLNVGK